MNKSPENGDIETEMMKLRVTLLWTSTCLEHDPKIGEIWVNNAIKITQANHSAIDLTTLQALVLKMGCTYGSGHEGAPVLLPGLLSFDSKTR